MRETNVAAHSGTDAGLKVPTVVECFIDGRWEAGEGDDAFDVINPATETVLSAARAVSLAQTDRALQAARRSFDEGSWRLQSPQQRSRKLHELADVIEAHRELLERQMVAEIGAPISLTRSLQVGGAIECLRWFADAAARGPRMGYEQGLPLHTVPIMTGSLLRREPAGVVSAITAYNYPLLLLVRKLGGALASGCSTVVMPSPRAPLTTATFFELARNVDLPDGVINLVIGGPEVGERLTTSPLVDLVTFTGSYDVGRKVMAQAAQGVKRVVLELGGKSPNIILPGADLDAAIGPSILRFSLNAGQGCGATTRTLVPRDQYDRYVEAAGSFMSRLVTGDPTRSDTDVGPLIREEHHARVKGYVDRALERGAKVEASGEHAETVGYYMSPLLLGHVDNADEVAQEELFGPVGVLMPYETVEEAVAIANASRFGLNANVWGPAHLAMEVARALRTGTVTINGGGGMRQDVPWGGLGASGVGREAGEEGFLEFFEVKHVQWPIGNETSKPFGAD
jgi:aldehyde dehydrogenase (NAD+)